MGVLFDKLNFMKRLEDAGAFTRPQAEALSEAFHQAVSESVATKQDVGDVRHEALEFRTESRSGFSEVRTELQAGLTSVRSELAELRTESRSGFSEVRTELQAGLASVRSELAELRTESRSDFSEIRTELRASLSEIRSEMKVGLADMKSSVSEMKVWSVSVGATIVAVLAAIKYFG